jgi:competence CoiA-like predicted nuclease
MLQAKTKDGTLVTLSMLTKAEISKLRKKGVLFYCPVCHQKVLMKAGVKMIPHFAHQSLTACPSGEGGEGIYHETGKLLLYEWLKQQGISVNLEVYLPEIRQRPDLLLSVLDKKIAVEFQCAAVSMEEVVNRTSGYQSAGIIPIWIVGGNRLQRTSTTHFKLNQQILPFIHQFSSNTNPALFFFSSETRHFILIQDIYLTGKTLAMGKFFIRRLEQLSFKDLFKEHAFVPGEFFRLWEKEKYRFRLKQSRRLYGRELAWHQWLYSKGVHREVLPALIHLPVPHQFKMKASPWNWQSRIIFDVIDPMAAGRLFSPKMVHHLLSSHLYPSNSFPLIHAGINPISEYLKLLSNLNVIQRVHDGKFMKTNPVYKPETIEQAINEDKRLLYLLAENKMFKHDKLSK